MEIEYSQDQIENVISDLIIESLESHDPEEFWRVVDSILQVTVSSVAYKFGKEKQMEVVNHMVDTILDTYETQKYFHSSSSSLGQRPKIH